MPVPSANGRAPNNAAIVVIRIGRKRNMQASKIASAVLIPSWLSLIHIFIRRGVPALAFKFGYQPGSPDETTRRNWVRDRYHKPSDDLTQPVDIAAAAKFDRIILRLMETVADDAARPQWRQDSFFRRFATAEK